MKKADKWSKRLTLLVDAKKKVKGKDKARVQAAINDEYKKLGTDMKGKLKAKAKKGVAKKTATTKVKKGVAKKIITGKATTFSRKRREGTSLGFFKNLGKEAFEGLKDKRMRDNANRKADAWMNANFDKEGNARSAREMKNFEKAAREFGKNKAVKSKPVKKTAKKTAKKKKK